MANRKQTVNANGVVIGAHGRHYVVELATGELVHCYPKGKKSLLACGDRVQVRRTGGERGTIESMTDRRSLLYRSDQFREKIIAANVTQVLIVVAGKPAFYEELLVRCLAAAEHQRLKILIVLNKIDLEAETAAAYERLRLYERLGYSLLRLAAREDVSPLRPRLQGETSVLVGQSGMGKSRIVKGLVPHEPVAIGELSATLDSGKHTTTSAHLYRLDTESHLIDSPGMQTFGLHHLSQAELVDTFPEFRPFAGRCRFNDCRHTVEPGCAILSAMQQGTIETRRWEAYRLLTEELLRKRPEWEKA